MSEQIPDGISIDGYGRVWVGIGGAGVVYVLRPDELRQLAGMLVEAAERIEQNPAVSALAALPAEGVA